jgi:hypothetical protein
LEPFATTADYLAQLERCAELLAETFENDDPEIESIKQRAVWVMRKKPARKGKRKALLGRPPR